MTPGQPERRVPPDEHREADQGEDGPEGCGGPGDEGDHGADTHGEEQSDDGEGRGEPQGQGGTGAQPGREASHWACDFTAAAACACSGGPRGGGQDGGEQSESAGVDGGEQSGAEREREEAAHSTPALVNAERI